MVDNEYLDCQKHSNCDENTSSSDYQIASNRTSAKKSNLSSSSSTSSSASSIMFNTSSSPSSSMMMNKKPIGNNLHASLASKKRRHNMIMSNEHSANFERISDSEMISNDIDENDNENEDSVNNDNDNMDESNATYENNKNDDLTRDDTSSMGSSLNDNTNHSESGKKTEEELTHASKNKKQLDAIEKSRINNDLADGLAQHLLSSRSANNTIDTSLLSSSLSASLSPSLKSASSSSNSSINQLKSASTFQSFGNSAAAAVAAEWYKQYEDRLFGNRNPILNAGLHNYLKPPVPPAISSASSTSSLNSNERPTSSRLSSPNGIQSQINAQQQQIQSSPISNNNQNTSQAGGLSDSSLLMERFYSSGLPHTLGNSSPFSNILKPPNSNATPSNDQQAADKLLAASHQALLAQYAQQFYLNNGIGGQMPQLPPPGSQLAGPNGYNQSRMAVAAAAMAAAAAASQNSSNPNNFNAHQSAIGNGSAESHLMEKERYLATLYNQNMSPFHSNFGSQNNLQFNSNYNHRNHNETMSPHLASTNGFNNSNGQRNLIDRDDSMHLDLRRSGSRRNNSSGSRSPSPTSSQQSGNGCDEDEEDCEDSQSINAANGEWTYEEQFKQLYELSDDVKRKEFLDDLFAFMQKRGSPVNRIPIMAKHVLDLYELYRLVVAKGGLVEVINKKLWREITKGLNLPSSITSAAFTLRTQYMKYLYPYECEKLKMSTPQELQSAIDGNRREGRRPVYGFEYASPSGMSSSGGVSSGNVNGSIGGNNVNSMGLGNSQSSSNLNIANSAAAVAALGLVKSSNLQNDLLNAAGLGHQLNNVGMHHPHHSLLQHPQNPHHAAFLAAAAAAAAQHSASHLYDPTGLHAHQMTQLNGGGIPPFLKPYFEINTPPSSSSSSTSSHIGELSSASSTSSSNENNLSGQINGNKSNLENENLQSSTPLSSNRNNLPSLIVASSQKRPFDHLDQNSDSQNTPNRQQNSSSSSNNKFNYSNETKEPANKKQQTSENNSKNDINSSTATTSTSSNKMRIKILSKDTSAADSSTEKSISLSIELNGNIYHGTLYASLSPSPSTSSASSTSSSSHSSSNPSSMITRESGSSNNNSVNLNLTQQIPSLISDATSTSKKFENSMKADLVY